MRSRWGCAAALTLSLLGPVTLVACGDEMRVVAPAGPTTSTPSVPGSGVVTTASSTTTTTTTAPTTTTTTTQPPTTVPSTEPPTTAPPATSPPEDPNQPYEGPEAESLAFVNARRAENGLHPLEVDPALTAMADDWAEQLAADQELRHNPDLGDEAPEQYGTVGENVGYAWEAAVIDEGWWESDGHRENILRSSFDAIGIAFVVDAEGTVWGVQVFAGG